MIKNKRLIIDDSALVLEMAKDMLQSSGFSVYTATNGIDATQYIFSMNNKPDLIILDI